MWPLVRIEIVGIPGHAGFDTGAATIIASAQLLHVLLQKRGVPSLTQLLEVCFADGRSSPRVAKCYFIPVAHKPRRGRKVSQ